MPEISVLGLEGDEAVVGVVGEGVHDHGENHDYVLSGFLHREEGDDIVGEVLPAESLKQYPADAQLQSQTDEETADEEEELAPEVVVGLEDPVAVPQETVDDTEDVASDVRNAIRQAEPSIEKIEGDEGDERVQHAYHSVFEQLYARLSRFFLVYLHDNSFNLAKIGLFNELTKIFGYFFIWVGQ